MVQVAMGIKQHPGGQAALCNKGRQFIFFSRKVTARVDDDAVFMLVVQDIGIFLYGAEDKGFYF